MGDVNLSKFLAKLLRHDAVDRGLDVTSDGYVRIEDILKLPRCSRYDADDIQKIVDTDCKGRFLIRGHGTNKEIAATQGHTFKVPDLELTPITTHLDARVVLHGTTERSWQLIKASGGLSKMRREHIHFAPGETDVQSGMPTKCQLAIEINLERALKDGLKFYHSANGVILSPGNHSGMILKRYFKRVYNIRTGETIPID